MNSISNYYDSNDKTVVLNKAQIYLAKNKAPFNLLQMKNEEISGRSWHTHDYIQIWYVMEGCFEHKVLTANYIMEKGDLFIIPPYIVHEVKIFEGKNVRVIGCEFLAVFLNESINENYIDSFLFDFAYLEPFFMANEMFQPRLHLKGESRIKVEELLINMFDEFTNRKKFFEISIKSDLLKMLTIIAREYENHINDEDKKLFIRYKDYINKTIEYINEHFAEKINLNELCRMSMMSHTYFSYIFKQITGKTYIHYINELRMKNALDLFKNNEMSISDICFASGFNNSTYFNKVFKRYTGFSPGKYKQLLNK
jgi:AraC-like DNA-binding protein/mannose-6-phosphate isomerase-like protein (cupin superfamily)